METTSKEKLSEYVSWFIDDLKDSLIFPIGAIIYSPQSLHVMAEELKNNGVAPLRYLLDEHPDVAIEKLFNFFEKEKVVALFIKDEIPSKLLNAMRDVQEGKMNVNLAGKTESFVLNPIPNGAKLILLVDEKNFDNLGLEKFALSVCRI